MNIFIYIFFFNFYSDLISDLIAVLCYPFFIITTYPVQNIMICLSNLARLKQSISLRYNMLHRCNSNQSTDIKTIRNAITNNIASTQFGTSNKLRRTMHVRNF